MNLFHIKILLFLLLLITPIYKGQDYSPFPKDIKITANYYDQGELIKAMKYNIETLDRYKKEGNKQGVTSIYINIGFLLFSVSELKESMLYLDKAKKEMKYDLSPLSQARLYSEYAKIYTRIGMLDQSNINFNTAIDYAGKIPNENQRNISLLYIYTWKRLNFLKDQDSLKYIDRKLLKLIPNSITYCKIADRYIENKIHLDSASYYLNKAMVMIPGNRSLPMKGMALFSYGKLYNVKKDYKKSLEYYIQSLQAFQKTKFRSQMRTVYDSISNAYSYLDDKENSNLYLKKYKALNDTIISERKGATNLVTNKLLHEEESKQKNYLYLIILGGILLSIIIIYSIFRVNKLHSRQIEKENLLEKQTLENYKLKKQLNTSADQLIKLAETNSSVFLKQFKETYPEFIGKLAHYTLAESDLKISAYLKLGLSTKQISQYENIALRTVENRKYKLKKKLNLDSEISLNKWIMEL